MAMRNVVGNWIQVGNVRLLSFKRKADNESHPPQSRRDETRRGQRRDGTDGKTRYDLAQCQMADRSRRGLAALSLRVGQR
jgi:hypothetical protein